MSDQYWVGKLHPEDSHITGLSRREILEGVEKGFGKLPAGYRIQNE